MKRTLSVMVVLSLALAGYVRAEDKGPAKDPLPYEGSVKWDVQYFEESATFALVKRQVKGGQLIFVLENKQNLGIEYVFGYHAEFRDEDGVTLFALQFGSEPFPGNLMKGERNRFSINLPQREKWKDVREVVIKGQ